MTSCRDGLKTRPTKMLAPYLPPERYPLFRGIAANSGRTYRRCCQVVTAMWRDFRSQKGGPTVRSAVSPNRLRSPNTQRVFWEMRAMSRKSRRRRVRSTGKHRQTPRNPIPERRFRADSQEFWDFLELPAIVPVAVKLKPVPLEHAPRHGGSAIGLQRIEFARLHHWKQPNGLALLNRSKRRM